jgi:hypothetical protein
MFLQVLLQDCNSALKALDEQPNHPFALILNARKHIICLADPSSSPKDIAAACDFFNRQPQVSEHIFDLQRLAEEEGGAIETISQVDRNALEFPSFLSNERFSLDAVLAPQLAGVNSSIARNLVPVHFLAALLPVSIAQGNLRETVKIINAIDSTAVWPTRIPSTSHLKQHRGAYKSASIFAPFSKGSGCAIIHFSTFSTVTSSTPITPASKAYFEVHVLSSGESPQFGLATENFPTCSEYSGDGVGDDAHSWGVDGVRHQIWHKGGSPADISWSQGDVVGFAVDTSAYTCDVAVNGKIVVILDISGAKSSGFLSKTRTLFPAFTGQNCCIKVNFGEDPFCHSMHSVRLLTAPPPAVLSPSLVEVIAKYLQLQDDACGSSLPVTPVSMWNLSDNISLRRNLSLDQMCQIAKLCPAVMLCASFIKGLFDRQQFAPQGCKVIARSPQHVLQICTTAEAVVRLLPNQHSGIALALGARIAFHRLDAQQQLGTCDAALLEQYLKMKRSHFLEFGYVSRIFCAIVLTHSSDIALK